eukprot:6818632-Alexandrium_andersonii.AAC.1
MADCGLRRIAVLTSLGRIADFTLGTRQCKDARLRLRRLLRTGSRVTDQRIADRCAPFGWHQRNTIR